MNRSSSGEENHRYWRRVTLSLFLRVFHLSLVVSVHADDTRRSGSVSTGRSRVHVLRSSIIIAATEGGGPELDIYVLLYRLDPGLFYTEILYTLIILDVPGFRMIFRVQTIHEMYESRILCVPN